MYIKSDFITRLTEASDIVEIIGTYVSDLKKKGVHYWCKSPFNDEKTASCYVDARKQRFFDYSADKSGDVISFIMDYENCSYPDAIEKLAAKMGYPVEYENEEVAKKKKETFEKKEALRPLLQAAHRKYQLALKDILSGLDLPHPAKDEIRKRSYTDHDIVDWGIGYAPGDKFIFDEVTRLGRADDARSIFLIGAQYDKYWKRIIYPIHDENGLLVGFAGRDVTGNKEAAKWINPGDNLLYHKEKTWFALHRAKKAISKANEAWILEGYNDVIAWHKHGIENTIAACGTSITERQVKILKRYTSRVIFCLDPDKAGNKALLTHIPAFYKEGFEVEIVQLPTHGSAKLDPDEFSRTILPHYGEREKYTWWMEALRKDPDADPPKDILTKLLTPSRQIAFELLIDYHLTGKNELKKSQGARELVKVVAGMPDESAQEIFLGWISTGSKVKQATINKWFKEEAAEVQEERQELQWYLLPKSVTTPLKDLKTDIEKYAMFVSDNRIWMMAGETKPYHFEDASNFSIEIIQHMQDEKLPMKLVRIRNIHGEERIFDIPSENLNTPMAFDNAMTNHGNFLWTAGRNEFQRLRAYLFDRMGVGSKIDVLGWQPDGFWVWNNSVTRPGEGNFPIDENGVYKTGKSSYYIPSANKIYANNSFKFMPQKKAELITSEVTFHQLATKMIQVHRSHAITGILFTIASTFLDIIEDKLGNFPLLFFYGPPSSGKDQLIDCCQSFYGHPQTPIHIGNKVSTQKAQVRKFAQFRNMIVHLSEYRPGDQQFDELLKGFWDRRGYERGNLDSAYGTDTVPVHSSVIFTGNHYPDDDALITRFICEEMTVSEFSLEEQARYNELKDMTKKGYSYLTANMLQYRSIWAEKFKETFRKVEKNLKSDLRVAVANNRMISNLAVLGTAYELMKDQPGIQFPFAFADFHDHCVYGLERQLRKLNTASVIMKWWDCFLASVRTKTDPLVHGREFAIQDNKLFFNFTHCYNRVITQWWVQYHEQTPSKSKIIDVVKKDVAFLDEKKSHRMDGTRAGNNTSAWVIDMARLNIADDLMEAIEWQKKEGKDMPPPPDTGGYGMGRTGDLDFGDGSPATPRKPPF